jgi:HD-like signal output (HDOD) protein
MSDDDRQTPETWQQVLKSTELRAMSGTLRELEQLIGNDGTTAKQLADIILKDVPLTSRVLTVANSVIHAPNRAANDEGALTQAIVRIGFNGLRAICISIAIMDSFLKKMPNHPEMIACVAHSFEVAVHARNAAKKTGAQQEDVFIAGLLQNLGELVFWCSTVPESSVYKELLECAVDTPEQAFKKLSGMDFQDMSEALAKEWKLSELLLESFGVKMTPETKAVHLGRRISSASKGGWESPAINKLLQTQLSDLGFDIMSGMKFMREGADEARQLAQNYTPKVQLNEPSVDVHNELQQKSTNIAGHTKASPTKKIAAKKTTKKKQSTPLIRS